jgi:hypothetical protein
MRRVLELILSKFPDHRHRIIDLYNKDEDFRLLCQDYISSTQALQKCRKDVFKDRTFEGEFLEVNLELEKEIVQLLERI